MVREDLLKITDRFMINDQDVVPQVKNTIKYEDLDYAPMVTFMMGIGQTRQIGDVTWRWPESRAETFQVTSSAISAVSAGVEQQITVKAGVVIGQQLFHGPTRQTFIVTDFVSKADDSTSPTGVTCTIKIKRNPFTSATTAIAGTPVLKVLALRTPTGGFYPVGQGSTPQWHTNTVQLCTNVVSISKTQQNVQNWYGSQLQKDIREQSQQHKGNNERVAWWGIGENEAVTLTNEDGFSSTGQLYGSQGIDDRTVTHRTPYTVLDKPTIMSWIANHCYGSRNSGPKKALLVAGPEAMQAINEIGENQFVALPGLESLGLNIKQFKAWGDRELAIVEEREFYGDGVNQSDEAGTLFKLNPDNMEICYLGSHFMEVNPINYGGQRDATGMVFRTEWGLGYQLEQQGAKLYKL